MDAFFSNIFHVLGYGLCHELPARSFFAGSVQFPVCTRDTGIYLGFMAAFVLLYFLYRPKKPMRFPPTAVKVIAIVLFLFMAVDGVTSYAGLRFTSNLIRFASGVSAGFAISILIVPIFNEVAYARNDDEMLLATPKAVLIWLGAAIATFVLGWWVLPLTGLFYACLSALTIVATFSIVNLCLVFLAFKPFTNTLKSLRTLIAPFLCSLVLTVLELGFIALLKLFTEGLILR